MHSPGIYSFKLFKPEINTKFCEEIKNIQKFFANNENKIPNSKPNPQNNYGVILNYFGFDLMISSLIKEICTPLFKSLWMGVGEESIDHYDAFSMEYSPAKDVHLPTHLDDSEITLNYCLGTEF